MLAKFLIRWLQSLAVATPGVVYLIQNQIQSRKSTIVNIIAIGRLRITFILQMSKIVPRQEHPSIHPKQCYQNYRQQLFLHPHHSGLISKFKRKLE